MNKTNIKFQLEGRAEPKKFFELIYLNTNRRWAHPEDPFKSIEFGVVCCGDDIESCIALNIHKPLFETGTLYVLI